MDAATRMKWKRSLIGAAGASLALLGGIAAIRGEMRFFGRVSGDLVSLSGHNAVAYGLVFVGIGIILLSQLTGRTYRNLISVLGGIVFLLAVAVQLSWIFAS
jgi:hypothetical protein